MKKYCINLSSCNHGHHIMIYPWIEGKNRAGYHKFIYLYDEQYQIIRDIPLIPKQFEKHCMYVPEEYILHKIYEILPEMFEE